MARSSSEPSLEVQVVTVEQAGIDGFDDMADATTVEATSLIS